MNLEGILQAELKGSIDFFLRYTNLDSGSQGYGLTVDSTKKPQVASIASVGFALTAWVIAAERGFLPKSEARQITLGALRTLAERASHVHGFFAHYLHMESGARFGKCEYSTIDTALCLNGVITAERYFQDADITELAQALLARVDWRFILFEKDGKALFRMAYNPNRGGDYVRGGDYDRGEPGFIHQWDMAAEQKMMYLQAAGQVDPLTARRLYQGFDRHVGFYQGQPIIINPGGNLFAYLFTEAWLDTQHYLDPDGVDWFDNTRLAALANRQYCLAHAHQFKTYHEKSWGASCGDSPWGYDVSGAEPSIHPPRLNGTVSIYSAVACLPFIPDLAGKMMAYLYFEQPRAWGPYGFYDAYNLDVDPPWYSRHLYGIDKGCSMIMIENHLSRLVWEVYTGSPLIQNALEVLGFTPRRNEPHD